MKQEVQPPRFVECRNSKECKGFINKWREPPHVADDAIEKHVNECVKRKGGRKYGTVPASVCAEPDNGYEQQTCPNNGEVGPIGVVVMLPVIN
jgi:hypothetical protein